MQSATEANHTRLIVILLPTKEAVYASARIGKLNLDPNYQKLLDMEGRIRLQIVATCEAKRIACVDALPYLTGALDRGERIYSTSTESHLNARGYFVIAAAVNENLGHLN